MTLANNYQQYVTPLLDTTFKQAVGTLLISTRYPGLSSHAVIKVNVPSTYKASSRRKHCIAPLADVRRV